MELSNTNLNLYKTFVVVFETKNMIRASEILKVTREAVRQNIKELGNQLGVQLFNSSNKGVEPTEVAKDIYSKIKNALEIILQSEISIASENRTIKMVVHPMFAMSYLNDYLKDFRSKNPDIQIELLQESDKADLLIGWDLSFENKKYKTIKLLDKSSGRFVASKQYIQEFNIPSVLTKNELIKYPIIEREDTFDLLRDCFGDMKFNIIKTSSIDAMFFMVKSGLGIGLWGDWFIKKMNDEDIIPLNVQDLFIKPRCMVCGYKSLSVSARKFAMGLVDFCNEKTTKV